MSRLRDAAANLKSSSGDPGLDAVLSEIELRVEVELAKAGQVLEPHRFNQVFGYHLRLASRFRCNKPVRCCAQFHAKAKCRFSSPLPILSVASRRYIRRARTDTFPARLARTDGLTLEKLKNYRPSEKEPFMNDRQRDYFRAKLLAWKDEILRESKITLQTLQEENVNHPDLADRASSETDRAIELRARDRQRKLISKIDAALQRIEDNTYGYCEETGEPISLKRLEARPIATLSVEAQERHEKREKVYRDE